MATRGARVSAPLLLLPLLLLAAAAELTFLSGKLLLLTPSLIIPQMAPSPTHPAPRERGRGGSERLRVVAAAARVSEVEPVGTVLREAERIGGPALARQTEWFSERRGVTLSAFPGAGAAETGGAGELSCK